MTPVPALVPFLLGLAVGLLSYGPVRRWRVSLRRATSDQMERPEAQGDESRALLVIFSTLHPAPWLLIIGVPLVLYQLAFGSMRVMWLWLVLGVLVGALLYFTSQKMFEHRARQ